MTQPHHIFQEPDALKALSEMIFVEGGSFVMGDDEKNWDATIRTKHLVTLNSFYLSKYPVTQALWKALAKDSTPAYFEGDERPVEQVSWFHAVVFCNALSRECGYEPCYFSDAAFEHLFGQNTEGGGFTLLNEGDVFFKPHTKGYRLPTEAEWEYAARGGQKSGNYIYAGGNRLDEVGWFDDNSHKETKPVGMKMSNELGFCDMSGNVWEWCSDWYDENYYTNSPSENPQGPQSGSFRVLRGGSWSYDGNYCRSSNRNWVGPFSRNYNFGFRLARD